MSNESLPLNGKKLCSACNCVRPLIDFNCSKRGYLGTKGTCILCDTSIPRESALIEKRCTRCKITKPIRSFRRNQKTYDKLTCHCRDCEADYRRLSKAKKPEYGKLWYDANRSRIRASTSDPMRRAKIMWDSAYARARNGSLTFSISLGWIEQRLRYGVCEVTGMQFDMGNKKSERSPSIDRIKPELGYTEDNCQVVIWQFNAAKLQFSLESVLAMSVALVNRYNLINQTQHISARRRSSSRLNAKAAMNQ